MTAGRRCLRCGSAERVQHHHVIPKALARNIGLDYWNLYASGKFVGCEPPQGFQEVAERWAALPHYTQRLCERCHDEVDHERKVLFKRIWEARRSQCGCFDCEYLREFDLGNLFVWFAPESSFAASSVLRSREI